LVDNFSVQELRQELLLGPITAGAVANVMKATQLEAERILDHGEVGIAGPGIDYVREHARNVQRWLESGRVFRVWTVDSEKDVALCQGLGIHEITTNKPAQVLAQLQVPSR
jgi:glycerophosphoryl diester phosphodiesterase